MLFWWERKMAITGVALIIENLTQVHFILDKYHYFPRNIYKGIVYIYMKYSLFRLNIMYSF